MRFRQTLLNFYRTRVDNVYRQTIASPESRPVLPRSASSTSSDCDTDAVVVTTRPVRQQLPTPSESSLDVSLQDARDVTMNEVPKGRARRVSSRLTKKQSQNGLVEDVENEDLKARTVSGETLVNMENASQSTLVKEGIAALDLPWNVSEVFTKQSKEDLLGGKNTAAKALKQSTETAQDVEVQRLRAEKAAAKKAKMAENNKMWEGRRKAAEKLSRRRSSRMPVLDKAGEVVASIANSVLGKRKDRTSDLCTATRSKSMGGDESASREPSSKKRRVSEADTPSEELVEQTPPTRRREKRWLASGLYAGQPRLVDMRPAKGRSKRTSLAPSEPVKENSVLPLPMFGGERLLQQGRDFKLPFDVFSPVPAGQPKPDEWRKVNKNVFVGDAAQTWRVSKYEEHSSCGCKRETGCDQNCMNRYMYYECDERNCNLEAQLCGNRAFEGLRQRVKKGGKYNIGVEVIKTEDRGYGVRSNRTFDPNQIIVEYTGEIITQEECERRMKTMYKNNECYYLMLFDQNMIIDATRGSIARFVNHSCEPNCRMEKWTVNGKPRMALFAGDRGIMTGEELSYDYNFDPYSQKNVQECRCGSEKCRGVLGPRSKEERKLKNPEEEKNKGRSKLAGAKRKIADVIEESASRITKKTKVATAPKRKVLGRSQSTSSVKVRKTKLMKKAVTRKTSATVGKGLSRRPSKLKTLVASARSKTVKRRVVSTSSSTALIEKKGPRKTTQASVSRSSSLREKASSVKSRVVRSVRATRRVRTKTVRAIEAEQGLA
ncbi:histone-lysine N-methyltransferase ASH1L [Cladophialophora psammophila CBS 110553]|uniref:Histone-lysine N-methyltransferase ASH1L n=1 Tax=Cladophialophora psammophila CBS 110553 TaxID=1182543 RepID=W9WTS4_9EURO|nr:histone-lysine N-methyltransferase ASH1L [Cladophialophora psammophila CBS 110553]EXJ68415.1 histone-lysine N-methyltransferase ASH1L [Cladophialophora psammophila CBS 110553]